MSPLRAPVPDRCDAGDGTQARHPEVAWPGRAGRRGNGPPATSRRSAWRMTTGACSATAVQAPLRGPPQPGCTSSCCTGTEAHPRPQRTTGRAGTPLSGAPGDGAPLPRSMRAPLLLPDRAWGSSGTVPTGGRPGPKLQRQEGFQAHAHNERPGRRGAPPAPGSGPDYRSLYPMGYIVRDGPHSDDEQARGTARVVTGR